MIEMQLRDKILYITINNPPVNIINIQVMKELTAVLQNSKEFFVAIKSEGKIFSAGADVKEHLPEKVEEMLNTFNIMANTLFSYNGIIFSLIHSHCYGGAMELALSCDFTIAKGGAIFSQPEIKLACFPPLALAWFPYIMPYKTFLRLVLKGDGITSDELERVGTIDKIVKSEQFFDEAHSFILDFTKLSKTAISITKRIIKNKYNKEVLDKLNEYTKIYVKELIKTKDAVEGVRAFIEKRQPTWEIINDKLRMEEIERVKG